MQVAEAMPGVLKLHVLCAQGTTDRRQEQALNMQMLDCGGAGVYAGPQLATTILGQQALRAFRVSLNHVQTTCQRHMCMQQVHA
jgi:hypothetical protein